MNGLIVFALLGIWLMLLGIVPALNRIARAIEHRNAQDGDAE